MGRKSAHKAKNQRNNKIPAYSTDAWENCNTRLGVANSRVNATNFKGRVSLDEGALSDLYRSDGLSRRVVDVLIEDAMRNFIEADPLLIDELERIKSKQKLIEAATYARLYGGSLLVAFVDDGKTMDKPLNLNGIKKVVKLQPYNRYRVSWEEEDLSQDYYDEGFNEPQFYTISPVNGGKFKVHKSRVCRMNGELLPELMKASNNFWHDSCLQSGYDSIRNYNVAKSVAAEMMQDSVQKIIYMKQLLQYVESGRLQEVYTRLNTWDLTTSVTNTGIMDMDYERYEKHNTNLSGISDLMDRMAEYVCSVYAMPYTKLFTRQTGGLNQSASGDIQNWNGKVVAFQKDELEPCITWIIELLNAQQLWEQSTRPEDYEFSFPPLHVPTELEDAEVKLKTAQLDSIYVNMGAVSADALYRARYKDGVFQPDVDPAVLEDADGIPDDQLDDQELTALEEEQNNESDILKKIVGNLANE